MRSCLLVGGAPTDHKGLDLVLAACHFDATFAVDAGYDPLIKRGIIPQGAFGDFDSLGFIPSPQKRMDIKSFDVHKDFTDMDWALVHAQERGFTNIVLCDGLDGRLDHTLGNLQLMARAATQGQRVWGITENEIVLTLNAESGLDNVQVDAGASGTCSVISHSDTAKGVSEKGMDYPLENACVKNSELWGISNELIKKEASISLRSGSLWVFLPLQELKRISYAGERIA